MSNNGINRFLGDGGMVWIWPKKQADKLLVCQYLATKFKVNTEYTEAEVNEILNKWHMFGDWALLRRELYERKLLSRNQDCTIYTKI
jgi:hypothetical protein